MSLDRQLTDPNQRIDLEAYQRATAGSETFDGYALELDKAFVEKMLLDNWARVTDGFRVEIPDQTAYPGDFAIHNGNAFDRQGRVVTDTSDADAQRTDTLAAINTVYYVSVQISLVAAATNSRAYWNPKYDNGADPSGDERTTGREYTRTGATVWRPQWSIVLSTAGYNTTSGTNQIPICKLATDGAGKIVSTTVPAREVMRASALAGATKIYMRSTRHLPDTFGATVGTDAGLTVTDNDRTAGILTLSAGLPHNQGLGARVIDTTGGATQFLETRHGSEYPVPVPGSGGFFPGTGSQDDRPRMFAGNEAAGYVALQDAESATALSDAYVKTLKEDLDALKASLRDIRFGGMLNPSKTNISDFGTGQFAVTSFSTAPRWYERAGGIAGAKGMTVSVGDGTSSYGDYNLCNYNSAAECFQAAINKIAASSATGGTLYIKRSSSPYDIGNTTVTITGMTNRLTIAGDGYMTNLRITGTAPVFTLVGAAKVHFSNIQLSRDGIGTGSHCVEAGASCMVTGDYCAIDGVYGSDILYVDFYKAQLSASTAGSGIALRGRLIGSLRESTAASTINNVASYAIQLSANSVLGLHSCALTCIGANTLGTVYVAAACTLAMDDVSMTSAGANVNFAGVYVPGGATEVNLSRCTVVGGGAYGLISAVNLTRAHISNCPALTYSQDYSCISLTGATAGKSYVIRDCTITQAASGGAKTGKAIFFADTDGVEIDNVRVVNADGAVYANGTLVANTTIRGLKVSNATATSGDFGVQLVPATLTHCTIDDCEITGLDNSGVAIVAGVLIAPTASAEAVSLTKNRIHGIGSATCATVYGIRMVGNITEYTVDDNTIGSKTASSLTSSTLTIGISLMDDGTDGPTDGSVDGNKLLNIAGLTTVTGIDMATYVAASVSGNKLREIGTAASTGNVAGIRFGWDTAVSGAVDQDNATFIGNNIKHVASSGAGSCMGIYGLVGVGRVTISLNPISDCKEGAAGGTGILLDTSTTATSYVRNVTLNGNIIAPSDTATYKFSYGIHIKGMQAADTEGQFSIVGNTVSHFTAVGIYLVPAGGDTFGGLAVMGNIIDSALSCAAGISVPTVAGASITGNTVNLTLAGQNQDGILVGTIAASEVVVSGNRVFVDTPAVGHYGVAATGLGVNVSSNTVKTGSHLRCIYVSGNGTVGSALCALNTVTTDGLNIAPWGIELVNGAVERSSTGKAYPYANDGSYLNVNT